MPALLGFVGLTLAALLVVPLWLDARIESLRAQIEAEVDHAAARGAELEREVALAAAAARGLLASGDSLFARDFAEADRAVVDALAALGAVAPTLGEDLPEAVERVRGAWQVWSRPVRLLVSGDKDLPAGVADLPLSQARYETLLRTAESLEDAVRWAGVERMARIRTLEQTQRDVTLALVPLALLAAWAVSWLGRRLYRQAEALAVREAELRALTTDLERRVAARTREVRRLSIAVVETERREQARIAQLLHDHLQQLLHGARFRLGFLDGDDARAVDGILADAIEAARTLAVELAPPVLREEGLPAALAWLGRHVERVNGLRVAVEADPEAACAPRHIQDLLFQLARELLFNVVKHAGVDEAAVTLRCEPASAEGGGRALTLVVADAGAGFDPAATPDGYGLGSVRERVALVEGRIRVASHPGGGTTVTVTVPLPEREGEPVGAGVLPAPALHEAVLR